MNVFCNLVVVLANLGPGTAGWLVGWRDGGLVGWWDGGVVEGMGGTECKLEAQIEMESSLSDFLLKKNKVFSVINFLHLICYICVL